MIMKNWKGNFWVKLLALVFAMASGLGTIYGFVGMGISLSYEPEDFWDIKMQEMYGYIRDRYVIVLILSIILFVISFGILMTVSGHRKESDEICLRWVDRVPLILYATVAIVGVTLGVMGDVAIVIMWAQEKMTFAQMVALVIGLAILWMLLALAFAMSVATRCKSKKFWNYTLVGMVCKPLKRALIVLKDATLKHIKAAVRVAVVLILLFVVEFGIVIYYSVYVEFFAIFIVYKVLETSAIVYFLVMLGRLWNGGRRVATGNYNEPIDTKYMLPALKEHGENINSVGEGIACAVNEQIKSERLKTELITNVSHDIKTPLTSIINYVDLLKKEDIEGDKAKEYIDVLDRQSAKLKKLIVDLMDATKASTGNVEVQMETVDGSVMISQIVGEYAEKLNARNIEVVVAVPQDALNIQADGNHLYRVFDNLLGNIDKYALENTRVYIDTEVGAEETKIIFKNISKYPLNISSDELMERFVRGDESRNTEGHGLGLSIAQSLMNLMGGSLQIEIDGDLFKAIVEVKNK